MRYLIFYVALIITALSCREKENLDPPYDFYSRVFTWQPGSYWVMMDSATKQIDSFRVITNRTITEEADDETWRMKLVEILESNSSVGNQTVTWSLNTGGLKVGSVLILRNLQTDSALIYPGFFHFTLGLQNGPIIQNNKTYEEVYVSDTRTSAPNANEWMALSINSNDGLIRIESKDRRYTHTWTLIDGKVIK